MSHTAPVPEEATSLARIQPPDGWQWINLRELWQHRELLYFFTWRDIKVRYKQTVLGAAWAVLQPTFMMIIFSFVLGRMSESKGLAVPYPVFVFAGLLPWTLFATGLGSSANSLVDSERLISKIYFPRLIIPIAAIGPALVDFCVSCVMLAVLCLWFGVYPSATILLAPLAITMLVLTVVGMGTLLSALNVAYRDFRYTTTFMLQAWMFATPAIYVPSFGQIIDGRSPVGNLASATAWFILANPLNGVIAFFRATILGTPLPWSMLGASLFVIAILLTIGLAYFRRVEDSFADVI